MAARDQDDGRPWARTDRAMAPPQRSFARQMRKTPTQTERKLWRHLRHRLPLHGSHFRRQVQIGSYIADFACHQLKLVIELDDGQHGWQTLKDEVRSGRLQADGYRVLRFWNNDVLSNIDGVLTAIQNAIATTPTPDPSPQGGGRTRNEAPMDLGIAGRKAIVCASSRGLGKACARALAEAGCEVVMNGRDEARLAAAAAEIAAATGVKVTPVAADVADPAGQKALLAACPAPDILVNNNSGPPFRDFRELTRQQMIDGVIANMIVAIELIQKVIDPMTARGFGRIVNITSGSVKMPLAGLDLSSGARAGLTAFLAGVARTVADKNVTINNILPGTFDTDRLRSNIKSNAQKMGTSEEEAAKARLATIPAHRFGAPAEFAAACAFLCSAQAGYITGQNLLIDGGAFNGAF